MQDNASVVSTDSKKRGVRRDDDENSYAKAEGERKKKKGPIPIAVEKQANVIPVTVEHPSGDDANEKTTEASTPMNLEFHFLPKDDIRRKFASMFIDALNQVDNQMDLDDFIRGFMTEDAFTYFKYVGTIPMNYFSEYIEMIGSESMLKFWKAILEAFPDSIYELHDTNIKVLMNGYSSITLKYTYTGTKVLDLVTDGSVNAVIITDNSTSDGKGGHNVYTFELENENGANRVADRAPTENKMLVGVTAKGERLCTVGTMTFHVNPDKKIYKGEFLHSLKSRGYVY